MGYKQIPDETENIIEKQPESFRWNLMAIAAAIRARRTLLAAMALNMAGTKYDYKTDKELLEASLIFMEVFMSKFYDHFSSKVSKSQLEWASTEAGKQFHDLILKFTGIDMKEVLK